MVDQPWRGWIEADIDRLYGFAYSLTRDRDQARDLAQESVARALAAKQWPDDRRAYRSWLFRIARNAFVDHWRRGGREIALESGETVADGLDCGWDGNSRIVDIVDVHISLTRLSVSHREIIALIDFVGFSYSEAAAVLGVAEGTIMSRVSRARKALLDIMSETNIASLETVRRARQ